MKYKMHVSYELERYPEACNECPAFSQHPYQCHNERGYEACCALGYMYGDDMRDFSGRRLYDGCKIRQDSRVFLSAMTIEEDANEAVD